MDLYFADAKDAKVYDCQSCKKNFPARSRIRGCETFGFQQMEKKPMRVDKFGGRYDFCPGKAQWFPELSLAFQQCLVAYETGILPSPGGLDEQTEMFAKAFPVFVEKYSWRKYGRIWQDINEFTPKVLEAVGKMFSGKKGSRGRK